MAERPAAIEGTEALEEIMRHAAPQLASSWSGDETLVGMVVEQPGGFAIAWTPRDRLVADLSARGDSEPRPARRGRYAHAITVLTAPPSAGKVSVLVAGWGDMIPLEVEAADLRMGQAMTSWNGGTA